MIGSSEVRISENVTVATSETNEKKINKERKGERVCREGSRGMRGDLEKGIVPAPARRMLEAMLGFPAMRFSPANDSKFEIKKTMT